MCSVLEDGGRDPTAILDKATAQCPRSAELFYLAARLSLSQQHQRPASLEKAVCHLQRCVSNFFKVPPAYKPDLQQTQLLYRYNIIASYM